MAKAVALAQAILDTMPKAGTFRREASARGQPHPVHRQIVVQRVDEFVAQYGKIIGAVPGALKDPRHGRRGAADLLRRPKKAGAPSEQGSGMPSLPDINAGDSPEKAAKSLLKKIPGGIALGPRTPLNVVHRYPARIRWCGFRWPKPRRWLASRGKVERHRWRSAGALRRYFAKQPAALANGGGHSGEFAHARRYPAKQPNDDAGEPWARIWPTRKNRFAAMRKSSEKPRCSPAA